MAEVPDDDLLESLDEDRSPGNLVDVDPDEVPGPRHEERSLREILAERVERERIEAAERHQRLRKARREQQERRVVEDGRRAARKAAQAVKAAGEQAVREFNTATQALERAHRSAQSVRLTRSNNVEWRAQRRLILAIERALEAVQQCRRGVLDRTPVAGDVQW